QSRDEQHRAERDALRIDGHRPVRDELVAGRPDAEWGLLDDEEARLAVHPAFDTHDPAIPQSRTALDVELPSEPHAHLGDHVPVAGAEGLGSLLAPPLVRDFIEGTVEPIFEVTERPEPQRNLALALRWGSGTVGVPEPREVGGVGTTGDEPQKERREAERDYGPRPPPPTPA